MCFVDTMNLDGETNLKEKMCPQGIKDIPTNKLIFSHSKIICDKPNEVLDKWECSYYFNDSLTPIICGYLIFFILFNIKIEYLLIQILYIRSYQINFLLKLLYLFN